MLLLASIGALTGTAGARCGSSGGPGDSVSAWLRRVVAPADSAVAGGATLMWLWSAVSVALEEYMPGDV